MVKALWSYIKNHKGHYLLIIISLMLENLSVLVPTRVTQAVIDQMTAGSLNQKTLNQQLLWLAIAVIFAYVAPYVWIKLLFGLSSRFGLELKTGMFDKLIKMRRPFFQHFRSGDLLTRFSNDVDSVAEMTGYGAMAIISGIGKLLFVLPAMALTAWPLAICTLIPLCLLAMLVYHIGRAQDKAVEALRESVSQVSNEVLEVVEGVRVSRAYGSVRTAQTQFETKTKDLRLKADKIMSYSALYSPILNVLVGVSTLSVIGLGGYLMQRGSVSLGQVIAVQLYAFALIEPMWLLSDLVLVYQTGNTAYKKIAELLEADDLMEADGDLPIDKLNTIQFNEVSFSYPNSERRSLQAINFELKAGETLGIVGKTGSGKTTLIRQLLRQYPLGQGQILLNQQPIEDFKREQIEALIAYVPQEHILFSKSIRDNIRLGKQDADEQDLLSAVEAAAFTKDLNLMAQGLDTLVGEKGVAISGGQKQRISIARALLKQPQLLILDDALSAVDANTERQIIQHIQTERKGMTNIIVTHRLSAVNHADWVIVLDEGMMVEAGTPKDLVAAKGWYAQQYDRQQREEA